MIEKMINESVDVKNKVKLKLSKKIEESANLIISSLKKGNKVYIEGRLQTRNWDDQNGTKHYRTEIVAENMIMLDRASGGSAERAPSVAPEPETIQLEEEKPDGDTKTIDVDNVPF